MSFPGLVSMGPPAEYIASMQAKKEIIAILCTALNDYLCWDIDSIIKQASRPFPKRRRPTMEDLNQAQEEVDAAERQLEALERFANQMPNELGQAYIDSQRPLLERLMEPAKERVAMIQKALEEPEPEPGSPWDGSHRISTLCAVCARPFDDTESSIPALKVALKAAGWGRDADGDHICPDCFSRMNARASEADSDRVSPTEKKD
jgi:hypothetical protein